jgi:hypothetical protein
MKAKILILLGLLSIMTSAYACKLQTIMTDKGIVSCYICPNMPPYCTGV